LLARNVSFQIADMRSIPEDFRTFDFLWSSCAMEHLGSLENGIEFVFKSMKCLVPGGVAVHTTEVNCDSNEETIEAGHDVIYRRNDLLRLTELLREEGDQVARMEFTLGQTDDDLYVDDVHYRGSLHIRLRIGKFSSSSYGLLIVARDH